MSGIQWSEGFRGRVWPTLPSSTHTRLSAYAQDLVHYNRAQNLVSRRDPDRRVALLIEESVAAAASLHTRGFLGTSWADVGSGGGIPGLALAAVFPDQPLTLIERRQGRCDFLRREVRVLGLGQVSVMEGDVVDCASTFGLVLAKAVAPPGDIEGLCGSILSESGCLVVFGRPGDQAAEGWVQAWTDELPGPDSVLRGLVRV